jgi:hypothetical protein
MVKIIISLLFLVGCSRMSTEKSNMSIFVENNTSYVLKNITIRYRDDELKFKKLKKHMTEKKIAHIGSDTSFDITLDIGEKHIKINNVGYYYYNGQDSVRLIFNNDRLLENTSNDKHYIGYSYR